MAALLEERALDNNKKGKGFLVLQRLQLQNMVVKMQDVIAAHMGHWGGVQ